MFSLLRRRAGSPQPAAVGLRRMAYGVLAIAGQRRAALYTALLQP